MDSADPRVGGPMARSAKRGAATMRSRCPVVPGLSKDRLVVALELCWCGLYDKSTGFHLETDDRRTCSEQRGQLGTCKLDLMPRVLRNFEPYHRYERLRGLEVRRKEALQDR